MRLAQRDRLGRNAARVEVERVGAVPADVRVAGAAAAALENLDVLQPGALAFEPERRCRALHGLAVEHGVGDLHPAEAIGLEVLARRRELAGQQSVDVVVVDGKRVTQVGDRPALDLDPRVDLFAAVLAREAQREAPGCLDRPTRPT